MAGLSKVGSSLPENLSDNSSLSGIDTTSGQESLRASRDLIEVEDADLKKLFPCSKRKAIRLSFRQLVYFVIVSLFCLVLDHYIISDIESEVIRDPIQTLMLSAIFLTGFNWLYAYWLVKLRGKTLEYFIKDGSVVITKGLFLKRRGSFHLSQITDVYLVQEQLDWLFKTCTLCVSTANQASGQFAYIEGFDEEVAHGMQEYLLKQTEISARIINSSGIYPLSHLT